MHTRVANVLRLNFCSRMLAGSITLALALCLFMLLPQTALAQNTFVSVAFHDVVDTESELDEDAVTTDRLIGFFEYLLADGWAVLTLDDVAAARAGERPLPPKSILITFDDGYESLYTRVFPLLKAYNFPIVSALVGQWMDAPMGAQVNYGGQLVPRSNFLSWEQARQMQASGLVEFASHSYDQHLSLQADIHGTQIPAMVTYAFEAQANQYEDPARFEARVRQDMMANNQLFVRELGKAPRAFIWPYGRYSLKTIEIARSLGYRFALNLNDEPSSVKEPMEIARYLPERNPGLNAMLTDLAHQPGFAPAARLLGIDIRQVWSPQASQFDRQLGQLIEDVRKLGPTAVVFKPYEVNQDGSIASWFAQKGTVVASTNAATRLTWQLQSRAAVEVYAQVSLQELLDALGSHERMLDWFDALGRHVPLSGIVFEEANWINTLQIEQLPVQGPWDVRQARRNINLAAQTPEAQLALRAFRQVERYRPTLDLVARVPATPDAVIDTSVLMPMVPSVIDLLLFESAALEGSPEGLAGSLPLFAQKPAAYRRIGFWLGDVQTMQQAQRIAQQSRSLIAAGVSALGWQAELGPEFDAAVDVLAPTVSAATFPVRF